MGVLNTILDTISNVFDFIVTVSGILITFVNFIPEPFKTVTLIFLALWFVIFVWKFSKGGS